jgi:small subunit ribosomal protein S16
MGAKKKPYYRVVVADSQAKRDGRFLEIIGTYDPNQNPAQVNLNTQRLDKWLQNGAQPTDTVASLIKNYSAPEVEGEAAGA